MRFNSNLSTTLILSAFILGGCVQPLDVGPQSYLPPTENDLNELANFETASGPVQTHPAAQRIEKLSREVMAILSNPSISKDQKETRFSKLLARDLDIPLIGRFAVGRHWRRANRKQR
jgi:PBP1b-binding outer membrane lipoprotein LpoB